MAGFTEVLVRALASSGAAVHEVALARAASVQDASCLFAVGGQSGEGVLTEPAAGAGSSPHVGPADEGATDGRPRGKGHAAGTPAPSNRPFQPPRRTALWSHPSRTARRVLTMGPMKLLLPLPLSYALRDRRRVASRRHAP